MNRKSYIDLLRYYLRDLPKNVIDDIVMDYEEHFAIGVSGGKSEEEISEELGSPETIAKEFLTIEPGRTRVRRITDQEKKLLEENESRSSEILKWIGIIALIVVLSPTILSIFGSCLGCPRSFYRPCGSRYIYNRRLNFWNRLSLCKPIYCFP